MSLSLLSPSLPPQWHFWSDGLVVSSRLHRNFSRWLGLINHSFAWRVPFTVTCDLDKHFTTSHFQLMQGLMSNQRRELGTRVQTSDRALCLHVALQIPRDILGLWKSCYGDVIPQLFLESFYITLFAPILIISTHNSHIKLLQTKPGIGLFVLENSEFRQITIALQVFFSRNWLLNPIETLSGAPNIFCHCSDF